MDSRFEGKTEEKIPKNDNGYKSKPRRCDVYLDRGKAPGKGTHRIRQKIKACLTGKACWEKSEIRKDFIRTNRMEGNVFVCKK